jgi:phage tail-like protein
MPSVQTTTGTRFFGQDKTTHPAVKFLFIIDSPKLSGAFTKVSGIQEDIEVLTQRDGQNPQQIRKMPGTFGGGEIKLERGVISELSDLTTWFALVRKCGFRSIGPSGYAVQLESIRTYLEVIALRCNVDGTNNYQEARRIRLKGVWPRRYELGDFDALSSDYQVESITLVFEEIEIPEAEANLSNQLREFLNRSQSQFSPFGVTGFAP